MNCLFSLVTVLVLVTTACGSSQESGKATQTTSPAASHAGTIAFASDRAGSFDIYVVNTDGTGLARLTSDDPGVEIHPVWSPDGTRIAYSSGPRATESGLYEIWVMNADGSGKRQLTGSSDDRWPAWSPDGSRIVFSRYPFPESPHLFTMNADGTDVQQLTFGLSVDDHPTWTTNDQILFRRNLTDGPYSDIFIMNADGSEIRRLTKGQQVSDYGVSSDGTELVFHDGKHERIMLLSAYGSGDAETLVDSKQLEQALQEESFGTPHLHPAWSPDGLWVAFAGAYGQTSNLRVVSVDGTGLVEVRHGEDATDPAWRPVVAP